MPAQGKVKRVLLSPTEWACYSENYFMLVSINNKALELPSAATITDMLEESGIQNTSGVAIAVNSDVIPRSKWQTYELKNNDKIMIIKATQGG